MGLDVSSVNKILNGRSGSAFSSKQIREVRRVARELGYDVGRLKHTHLRSHARKESMITVELSVYREGGALYDRGTAVARNLSASGALLIALVLSRQAIPLAPHTIGLRPIGGATPSPEFMGRVVRFDHAGDSIGLAVEFLDDQSENVAVFCRKLRRGSTSRARGRAP